MDKNAVTFDLRGQREADLLSLQLQEGRRNMAFDFCFATLYPSAEEESLRECIYAYSGWAKQSEKIFGQYIRERGSRRG